MDVLEDMAEGQVNLASTAARKMVATTIIAALKTKGSYKEYTEYELDEQKAREYWVCGVCGKSTFDVEDDYLVHPKLHLGCALEEEKKGKDIKEQYLEASEKYFNDHKDEPVRTEDGEYVEVERREKNWLQKKHEDKVFGKPGKWREDIQGQIKSRGIIKPKKRVKKKWYEDMGDGHMLEVGKLAEEIVDNQNEKWIYESPDGGNTVFRRPFGDYDMKNKEEIDFKTKEPTGRMFTDYPFKEIQIDGC